MFVKLSILKKLMKQAYKSGLTLANSGERILIAGRYWEMDIRKEEMPKELLTAVIELVGELPEPGKRYSCTKDGNQQECGKALEVDPELFITEYLVTDMTLLAKTGTKQRILQNYGTGAGELINEVFIDLVYDGEINGSRGETAPAGPFCKIGTGALWENNIMRFKAGFRIDDENEALLQQFQNVDLTPCRERKQA